VAVIAVFRVKGDPDELLAKFEQAIPEIEDSAHGVPQVHVTARTDDGIVIYDVWDSHGDIAQFTENPDFQKAIEAVDLPQPEVAVYEVHRIGWSRRQ
jgi:quinol monooxygenase YgiN